MGNIKRNSNDKGSSDMDNNVTVPKPEMLDFELPSETMYSQQVGENVASSSGSNLRSFFTGMGFLPSLVDKVIEENGEGNFDLLLETLIECSDLHKSNSQSSDSLNSLFDDKDVSGPPEFSTSKFILPKEEPYISDAVDDDKRASLLNMNFTVNEVEFAMDKLGEYAPISEIVDFITAAQIAEKLDKETDNMPNGDAEKNEDRNNETLFGTMEKTLRLLEMGFSENEVSLAIERFGSEVPMSELADWICACQVGDDYITKDKYSSENFSMKTSHVARDYQSFNMGMENYPRHCAYGTINIKTEDFSQDAVSQSRDTNMVRTHKGKRPTEDFSQEAVFQSRDTNMVRTHKGKGPTEDFSQEAVFQSRDTNMVQTHKGKRAKQGYIEDHPDAQFRHIDFEENYKGKQPKQENADDSSSCFEPMWVEEKVDPEITRFGMLKTIKSNSCKILDRMVAKPPYFFYGNVATVSSDIWGKISQFLYAIEPEFVNTLFFSALSRKEGYIHNLPTENRFHILPKLPMTIEDVIPHTKKWWPSWDTRKQLSCISCETSEVSQLCDRLGRMVIDAGGVLSSEQKRDILHHCQALNLMWVGPNKLAPMGPEHLEHILGYPWNHTQSTESSLMERLQSLGYCFQTDTLGYHLSVLKSMFPGGMTILSIFSGIGGAEIALHRLGIHLKGVVSVETSERNRKILRRWWHSSGQAGQLEQIEDIQKLTSNKIDKLVEKFGSFDFIICQNSFSHSSKMPTMGSFVETRPVFDFSLFYEFVRVLQRVRSTKERKR